MYFSRPSHRLSLVLLRRDSIPTLHLDRILWFVLGDSSTIHRPFLYNEVLGGDGPWQEN